MNLKDISEKYQENLVNFFNNDKVIDFIYKEQYGEKNYEENKEICRKEYKNIIDNTVFVPYITLQHLEDFIKSAENKHGQKYVEKNLNSENNLLRRLYIKRDSIIKENFSVLYDELKQLNPKLNDVDLTKSMYEDVQQKNPLTNVDSIVKNLENILNQNKQPLHPFKNKKVSQLVAKFQIDIKDKILIETSSYFKHKTDVSKNDNYVYVIENLTKGGQRVQEHIDENPEKNCRYIYLPVLTYKTKQDYLKDAVHEVMHISKEKITGTRWKSGFMKSLTVKEHPIKSLIQSLRWASLKKDFSKIKNLNFPNESEKYKSSSGEIAMEEVVHHWQVRNVVKNILNSDIANEFKAPYIPEHNENEETSYKLADATTSKSMKSLSLRKAIQEITNGNLSVDSSEQEKTSYEDADATTSKFMESFGKDIQEINNGNLSIGSFKRKVGKSSFDSLSHLFDIWTSEKPKTVPLQSTYSNRKVSSEDSKVFSEMGDVIVNKMNFNASKFRKDSILEKTIDITASKICEIGSFLDRNIELSVLKGKNQTSTKEQAKINDIER